MGISEARTIARNIDFLHIPVQHNPEQLRDLYVEVSKSCGYDNFIRVGTGARLETVLENGGSSRLTFSNDRISFQEEHNNISLESQVRRVEEVIKVVTAKLGIPIYVCRNITLRAVAAAPTHSSQFITDNLFQVDGDEMDPFGRSGRIVGFRMHFPPTDPKDGLHQIRMESYLRDPRSLFLEDIGTFKLPMQPGEVKRIRELLVEVDNFVHERMCKFLNQFPRKQPGI